MGVPVPGMGNGLQAYQAFVLLQKIMQHQSDSRTAYSSTNRANQIVFIGFLAPLLILSSVVRGTTKIIVITHAVEQMLDRLATRPPIFGTGTPIYPLPYNYLL